MVICILCSLPYFTFGIFFKQYRKVPGFPTGVENIWGAVHPIGGGGGRGGGALQNLMGRGLE